MWKSSVRFVLAAANLLIAGSAMAAVAPVVATPEGKIEALNAASVKAVEGSWLDVPTECKARGFNADAQTVALKEPQPHVRDIYASFGF
ncbi:MAG: hypothetical protein ACAI38_04265 [Myxococcota bacterium]